LKVYPLLMKIASVITNRIMPMYGEGLVCEPEDIRITDQVLRMQEIEVYSKTHTVDEVREKYWQSDPLNDEIGELLVSVAQTYKETPEPEQTEIVTPEPVYNETIPASEMSADENNPEVDDMETRAEIQPVKADIYPAMLELEKWERKARKANGKPVEFIAYNIPAEVVSAVKAGMTFADARLMLQGQPDKPKEINPDLENLVKALDVTIKAMEISAAQPAQKQEPMTLNIHNYPGKEPEVKADSSPVINIPATVVNVAPGPAPVVNNVINVPEQEAPTVNVNMPTPEKKKAKVTRGQDGKINGIDEI